MLTWQVQLFDTDAYGIMWHGAYAKWLEYARHHWLQQRGYTLQPPQAATVVFPVLEQQVRYKQAARQNDTLAIVTTLTVKLPRLVFEQQVLQVDDTQAKVLGVGVQSISLPAELPTVLIAEATTTCLLTTPTFKPLRKLPPELAFLAG
jgi:YbgC/YbaW family acyl-CoA thioester hydrolase